ncbi:MAG: 4-(cytidine 5'-diphospho)-2-C-methyl-D-erythritol kinase [Bacteroidales bacterium]|nr:4-(cytidine 5'-diphospho)-2-C-methyl-D-erythritol kinase [Bacteroidales bacterium]
MITHPHVKINLGLSVIRKRADGYHDLETVFVPYREISDTLEIVPADTFGETAAPLFARYGHEHVVQDISPDGKLMITLARTGGVDWDPLSDLTARAYGLLDADFQLPPVKIYLEKNSPVGAGLGGGSSDAAFALRMLADLFNLPLSREQLAAYAARLGSDCAFFIYEEPMLGTGRGEVLTPFPLSLEGYQLQVLVPEGIAVSTADAYRGIVPREVRENQPVPLREALARPVSEWKDCLENDFEETVFAKHPELAAVKQSLYDAGAVYAAMSGSGSALFALFATSAGI